MVEPGRPETYIIDGYNLLRRAFRFFEDEHGLEAARSKLEVRLREYLRAAGEGTRILLVYDGALGVERGGPQEREGLEVVFSRPPESADERILAESRRLAGSTS